MDDYTPTTEEVRLLVVDGRWNTGAVDAVMFDRWLAERDREVAERAWAEGAQWAAVELQAIERVENQWVGRVTTRIGWVSHPPQNYRMKGTPPMADELSGDWKQTHANEASASIKHELVEGVIEEFMDNINVADEGLPAYGIRKVAHYAATVARAHALGFDPNLLRQSPAGATSHQLHLAAMAVTLGVPVHMIEDAPNSGEADRG